MEPGAVSSSRPVTERVVANDGMFSVIDIIIWFNFFGGYEGVVNAPTEFPEVT